MSDPFKVQLRPLNPHPAEDQAKPTPLNESGEALARDGFSVRARADRKDSFQPTIPYGQPVTDDRPLVAWDEDK